MHRLGKRVERDGRRYLDILDYTLARVSTEGGGIEIEFKLEASAVLDLDRFVIVNLSHTFDFHELHIVAILVAMAFVLMDSDIRALSLLDVGDDKLFGGLTIKVEDLVRFTVVDEDISSSSKRLTENESNIVLAALFIDVHKVIEAGQILRAADETVVGGISR